METIIAFTKINDERDVLIREIANKGHSTYCVQVRKNLVPVELKIFGDNYSEAEKFYEGFMTELVEELE